MSDDVKTSDGGTESARAREPDSGALVDSLGLWAPRGNEVRVVALSALGIAAFPYLFSRAPVLDGLVQGYQGLATLVLIWGIFALGFDLLLGYTGLLSFGHAAFWGGAAYAAGIFSSQVSGEPVLMVAAGTAFALLLAWILGFLSLRRGGIYFSILTLAFGQMMFYISSSPLASLTGGENGFTDVQTAELFGLVSLESDLPGVLETLLGTWLYVFVGVLTLFCIAFAYRLLNSPYGIVFRAIRENEQRAEFVGLNVWRYKLMAFVISGGLAGVAGSLFAIHGAYVPLQSLYWTESGEIVIMTVLGGTGTLFGPMLGAGLYLYVENIVSGGHPVEWIAPFWHLTLGLLFVVVIWLFPRGLGGGIADLWWFLRLAVTDPAAARDHVVSKLRSWLAGVQAFVRRVLAFPGRVAAFFGGDR